jgi:hypothetical protein
MAGVGIEYSQLKGLGWPRSVRTTKHGPGHEGLRVWDLVNCRSVVIPRHGM